MNEISIPVFGYARVSGVSQADGDKDGIPRQSEAIRKFCSERGFELKHIYEEEGFSGTIGFDEELSEMRNPQILRPAFKEMMAAIMSNGVKTIVVERLDRLSRKYVIQEQLLLYVAGKECDFYSADTGDNVAEAIRGDPMKKAIIQMQGIFLELERSMLVKKLKIAKDKKRAAGFRVDGMLPFGEKLGEKEVVARMVELRGQGLTPGHIAEKLNAEGAKTRMNAKWHRTSIIRVLGRAAV